MSPDILYGPEASLFASQASAEAVDAGPDPGGDTLLLNARPEEKALLLNARPEEKAHCLALSGKRIMLMEDDDRLYGAIKDTLEDFGCEIMGSCLRICGPLEMVPRSHLDAALIDLERLSIERSIAIVSRLHERGVPVVLITYLPLESLPNALQGCTRLLKPFTGEQMLSGLATAIEGARHASERSHDSPVAGAFG